MRRRWRCIRSTPTTALGDLKQAAQHRLLQHHHVLPQGVPGNITITDNAIIPLKERVVDRFFDPLGKLFRVFRSGG